MYYFETHITVDLNKDTLQEFKKACEVIKSKAIIIDMQKSSQVMTSKTDKYSDLYSCLFESQSDVAALKVLGFNCVRLKIEVEPSYIDSLNPSNRDKNFIYYEIHIKCNSKLLNEFDLNTLSNNWYKSKNRFKDNIHFITFRSKDESLIPLVNQDYDSNLNLDSQWIPNYD